MGLNLKNLCDVETRGASGCWLCICSGSSGVRGMFYSQLISWSGILLIHTDIYFVKQHSVYLLTPCPQMHTYSRALWLIFNAETFVSSVYPMIYWTNEKEGLSLQSSVNLWITLLYSQFIPLSGVCRRFHHKYSRDIICCGADLFVSQGYYFNSLIITMSMFHHLVFLCVCVNVCLFIPRTGSFPYQLFILESFITYAECVDY